MRQICVLLAAVLLPGVLAAAVPDYQAIRDARPDGSVAVVENLILQRDAYRFELKSGAFHFLAPVNGKVFGAVFLGDGSYTLQPATPAEKRQLRMITRETNLEVLADHFDEMVLLFSDDTAAEIAKHSAIRTIAADARARAVYEKHLDWQRKKEAPNLHLRILEEFLNRPARNDGIFVAHIDGRKYAPALLIVDPLGISSLAARFGAFSGDEVAFLSFDELSPGFWYLCPRATNAVNGRSRPIHLPADAQHYDITTSIDGQKIEGTTIVRFIANDEGLRVLPINILPKLKIRSARLVTGGVSEDLGIVQEEVDRTLMAKLFRNEVADADAAIVFPKPLEKNAAVEISLDYGGDGVLLPYGYGYSVRARESWYPNLGTFTDLATYDLKFRCPKRNNLVAVGALVDEHIEGAQRVAHWKSDIPIRVAGFNYGTFEKVSRRDAPSGVDVEVYTDKMWTKRAEDTLVDAMNAERTATAFFGRPLFPRVAVAQQIEWGFGQSWPTLVYLPTLALTTSAERVFGIGGSPEQTFSVNEFAKTVTWHEVSHQWWGHEVGWQTYRDQWLSEGFAEFTAALVLQFAESMGSYDTFWEQRRQHILTKHGSVSNDQAGPISQGYRLESRSAPEAAGVIMYEKGAYVVHMLRMMLRDATSRNPDERFIALMQDYVSSYAGKNPSTADFQAVVERHMTPAMDAAGTHHMDYFFAQWVDGTEIPRLKCDVQASDAGGGKYRISGTVSQEEVSEDFRTLVPLYLDFGEGNIARVAMVRVSGRTPTRIDFEAKLPTKPRKVVVNVRHDVLARD